MKKIVQKQTKITSDGYFGNYEKLVHFFGESYFWKIVADFQNFKTSLKTSKINVVCPSKSIVEVVV